MKTAALNQAMQAYADAARQIKAGSGAQASSGAVGSFDTLLRQHLETSIDDLHESERQGLAAAAGTADLQSVVEALSQAELTRRSGAPKATVSRIMRKLTSEKRAYFVLAGYWDLYAAKFLDPDHPLHNLGELVELGPLDRAGRHICRNGRLWCQRTL